LTTAHPHNVTSGINSDTSLIFACDILWVLARVAGFGITTASRRNSRKSIVPGDQADSPLEDGKCPFVKD